MIEILKTINEALTGTKTLKDIFTKLRSGNAKPEDISAAYERVLNLQQSILDTKEALILLQDEKTSLKEQIRKYKDFKIYRKNFVLHPIAPGALAYVSKEAKEINNTIAWYCQTCFDKEQKSVFQFAKRESQHDIYQCYLCSAQLRVPHGIKNESKISLSGKSGRFSGDW